MLLSSYTADQIVSQLSKVMEPHINIMDTRGVIISSTNPLRIGSIHGGAVKILEERLSELMIESDDQYPGAKNGINLPIEFNNEMIGVIGLTGKSEEVYRFGQIIKKMTEVLLLDIYVRQQKQIEQKAKDRFLEEWIFGKYDLNHPVEFKERAKMLGIDVESSKRILVLAVRNEQQQQVNDQVQSDISSRIRNMLSHQAQAYLFRTSTLYVGVINDCSDHEILKIAHQIQEILSIDFQITSYIGISDSNNTTIRSAFKHANLAFQTSLKSIYPIHIYDSLNFDILINQMLTPHRHSYLERLFANQNKETMVAFIEMLRVFYHFDGSIEQTSKHLFVHKNTLQYRLNRLTDITGYDPRKLSTAYLYNIAIKIHDSLNQEI
jgi:carbohydrate diacid regulator